MNDPRMNDRYHYTNNSFKHITLEDTKIEFLGMISIPHPLHHQIREPWCMCSDELKWKWDRARTS